MATFPNDRVPAHGQQSAVLYSDLGLTKKAAIFDANGSPIPASQIVVGQDGLWPLFTSPAPVVYFRDIRGFVVSLVPAITLGASITVTGSKASGAAFTSLVAALAALGIPIVDGSSA